MVTEKVRNTGDFSPDLMGRAQKQHQKGSALKSNCRRPQCRNDGEIPSRDPEPPCKQIDPVPEPVRKQANPHHDVADDRSRQTSVRSQASTGGMSVSAPSIPLQKLIHAFEMEHEAVVEGKLSSVVSSASASHGRRGTDVVQHTGKPTAVEKRAIAEQKMRASSKAGVPQLRALYSAPDPMLKPGLQHQVKEGKKITTSRTLLRSSSNHASFPRPGAQAHDNLAEKSLRTQAQLIETMSPVDLLGGIQFRHLHSDDWDTSPSIPIRGSAFKMGVGIETEFLLKARSPSPNQAESMRDFANGMVRKLSSSVRADHPIFAKFQNDSEEVNTSKWNILRDSSIATEAEPWGLEMVSPILVAFPSSTWREIVSETWRALTKHYQVSGSTECGTHIHVSVEGGYSLDDLKRIVRSAIHFQSALDTLVPADRKSSNCLFARDLGTASFATMEVRALRSSTQLLVAIENCSSCRHLIWMVNPGHFFTAFVFNFHSLYKYGTIEFRKPPSCTSADQALAWAELAITFVRSAIRFGSANEFCTDDRSPTDLYNFLVRSAVPGLNEHQRLKRLFPHLATRLRSGPDSHSNQSAGCSSSN